MRTLLMATAAGALLVASARALRNPGARDLPDSTAAEPRPAMGTLKVLSLNQGHARGTSRSQWRVRRAGHHAALANIAAMIQREDPDIVAVQEIDAPSWWSGGFDHSHQLRDLLDGVAAAHGTHAHAPGLAYGTALFGIDTLTDASSHPFGAMGPTPRKGFTIATATLDGVPIDVVSLHLDFALRWVREAQLRQLESVLADRQRPCILMGDFNMSASALEPFRTRNSFSRAQTGSTFPGMDTDIDHIFVSPEFVVLDAEVLTETLSDHRALHATLTWRSKPPG